MNIKEKVLYKFLLKNEFCFIDVDRKYKLWGCKVYDSGKVYLIFLRQYQLNKRLEFYSFVHGGDYSVKAEYSDLQERFKIFCEYIYEAGGDK